MRRFLLSTMALTGLALASQFAGAGEARAQPVSIEPGLIHSVQYRDGRWHDRHEYWRWRRHEEWRHRHWAYRHRY